MKKTKKSMLSLLIGAVCVCLAFGVSACEAAETPDDDCKLAFEKNDEGYTVTGIGEYTDGVLTVPETYKGEPVTAIAAEAFQGYTEIGEVVIPDSVTSIGAFAFSVCPNILKITLGDGLKEIGEEAFSYCHNLREVDLGGTVEVIGDKAFMNCLRVPEIVLPESVLTIGNSAFLDCDLLENVTFGAKLEKIGTRAFYGCDELLGVNIPGGAQTEIGDEAFDVCGKVREIVLGDGVKSIGVRSFDQCYQARYIILGDGVTTIGEQAFNRCTNAVHITVGKSVTNIDKNAFSCCYIMREVYNRSALSLAPETGGNGNVALRALYVYTESGNSRLSATEDGLVLFTLPDEVMLVSGLQMKNYDLVVPENVTTIGYRSFYNNQYITNVFIGDNVKKIENSAFQNSYKIKLVVIGDNVTEIGDSAFRGSRATTKIVLGKNVRSVGLEAFYKMFQYGTTKAFESVYFAGTESEWSEIVWADGNTHLTDDATVYFYSETEPLAAGNYWRYVDGEPVVWGA